MINITSKQDKINFIIEHCNQNIPNHGYSTLDQYAYEWGCKTFNELLQSDNSVIDELYQSCLNDY